MMNLMKFLYELIYRYVPPIQPIFEEWNEFLYNPEVNAQLMHYWVLWHWIPDGLVLSRVAWSIWKHSSVRKFLKLSKHTESVNLERFASIYAQNKAIHRIGSLTDNDTPGVYVIMNHSKHLALAYATYTLLNDVNEQMQGNRCRRLFSDIQNGDDITIKMIPFRDSGFKSLKKMEKIAIMLNKANSGYNSEL